MKKILSFLILGFLITFSNNYLSAQIYCTAKGDNEYVKLKLATSGCGAGEDFTQEEATNPGFYFDHLSYSLKREIGGNITLDFSSSSSAGISYVYVDWTQAGDAGFEQVGSITNTCCPSNSLSFTVPPHAKP